MADINWQPISIEKPQFESAQSVLEGMRKMREDRKKFGIEKAMRSGLKADGSIDPNAMRQSLISQGFGEEADNVVSQVMGQRQKDVGNTVDLEYKMKMLSDAGVIDPQRAGELFNNSQSVNVKKAAYSAGANADTSWADTTSTDKPSNPNSNSNPNMKLGANEVLVTPEGKPTGGEYKLPEITPENEYEIQKKPAQVTPEYATDLFKFGKKDDSASGMATNPNSSSAKWQLPSDELLKSSVLQAANSMGYDLKNNGVDLDKQAISRAEASVPQVAMFIPPTNMSDYAKTVTEYNQKLNDRAAKVQELALKDLGKLEETGRAYRDQARSDDKNLRDKESQEYALAGQKDTKIFARPVSSKEAEVVKLQRATIDDIDSAGNDFAGAYKSAVAKAKSDGSVNQDAILANLVAMGAMPSSQALVLKTFMSPDGGLTAPALKWIASNAFSEKGPSAKWKSDAISNINQYIVDNGGLAYKNTTKKFAADSLKEKGVGVSKVSAPVTAPKVSAPVPAPVKSQKQDATRASKKGR